MQTTLERDISRILRETVEISKRWETATQSSIARLLASASQKQAFLADLSEMNTAFADLCVRLGWPPPGDVGVHVIDLILAAEKAGSLSSTDVTELFIEYYSPERIDAITERWKSYTWLRQRVPILAEGIQDHKDGRFFSSVCLLLMQVEGVIGTFLGREPNAQNDARLVFQDSKLSAAAEGFYVRVAKESFDWTFEQGSRGLARRSIMHGHNVAYGTAGHSLQTILILNWILTV